jgi:S1-C subfamily serine protease
LGKYNNKLLFATALHILQNAPQIVVVLPPHGGDCSIVQLYTSEGKHAAIQPASVLATNPFADLAVLATDWHEDNLLPRSPSIVARPESLAVGSEIVVYGYPFATPPLNSMLETRTPGFITALAQRQLVPRVVIDEIVISVVAHPGLSGSAIVGRYNGLLCGILRGSLAPPPIMRMGNLSVGVDTSVTFATSAHLLHDLIQTSQRHLEAQS